MTNPGPCSRRVLTRVAAGGGPKVSLLIYIHTSISVLNLHAYIYMYTRRNDESQPMRQTGPDMGSIERRARRAFYIYIYISISVLILHAYTYTYTR